MLAALSICGVAAAQESTFDPSRTTDLRMGLKEWNRMLDSNDGRPSEMRDNAHEAFGFMSGASQVLFDMHVTCLPNGVTHAQTIAIFLKYTDDHPDRWQLSSDAVIAAALSESFPCKKS